MEEKKHIRSLLIKYLQGSCNGHELELLMNHLKQSGSVEDMPSVENVNEMLASDVYLDDETSSRIFNGIISADRVPVIPISKPRFRYNLKIAAAIALLCVAAIVIYATLKPGPTIYDNPYGRTLVFTLSDGSKVTLNSHSQLKVSEDFGQNGTREVWLDGEAFFSVSHDASQKFIVHTTKVMSVEVLGTEFNVNDRDDKAAVVLNKGSVRVNIQPKGGEKVEQMIKPGQRAVYHKNNRRLVVSNVDTMLYSAWKYNLLAFKNTRLDEVAEKIESQYGYSVELANDSIAALHFTGSIPTDSLNMALDMLERSFGLETNIDKKNIYIDKKP